MAMIGAVGDAVRAEWALVLEARPVDEEAMRRLGGCPRNGCGAWANKKYGASSSELRAGYHARYGGFRKRASTRCLTT